MKLTVGPLPPAVYWRRRASVVGTLLLVVIVLLYSCGGNSNVSQRDRAQSAGGRTSPSPTRSASPSPSALVFTPGGGIDIPTGGGDDAQSPSASPSLVPAAQPSPVPSGPCTDGEIAVTAVAASSSVTQGGTVRFYLRVKNISNRSCTRDVGADAQELYLQNAAKAKVWSSDSCDPLHGTDVRMFGPNIEAEFFLDWHGNATNNGCPGAKAPSGRYQLVARLATKLSDPVAFEVK